MNSMTLYGRLGQDKNIKDINGKRLIELNVATNEKEKGADITIWWKVTLWDDKYRNIEEYLKKGSALIIHGEMRRPRTYLDRDGNTKIALEMTGHSIQFNPFGKSKDEDKEQKSQHAKPSKEPQAMAGEPEMFDC